MPEPMTSDELHARIEARYQKWLDAWRLEHNHDPEGGWAADMPSPGQTFSDMPRNDLHLFMGPSYD